jgi:hypothetical protein
MGAPLIDVQASKISMGILLALGVRDANLLQSKTHQFACRLQRSSWSLVTESYGSLRARRSKADKAQRVYGSFVQAGGAAVFGFGF